MIARRRGKRLSTLMLVAAVFCCVSGGAFGLEQAVEAVGPGVAILLIAALPLLWALPDSLTTCELAPAIPEEGGYVVWVRRALGPFWGFLNAWWTMVYAILDAALYPLLFSEYMASVLAEFAGITVLQDNPVAKWLVAAAMIAAITVLNVRGIRQVGGASIGFALAILSPFAAMVLIGVIRAVSEGRTFDVSVDGFEGSLGTGLAIVMWNYLGWDALSTVAGEVENPQRAYPRAMLIGVTIVTAAYLFPVLVGVLFAPSPDNWAEGAWPSIAKEIGGNALGIGMATAALVSPIALFTASVLGSSRIPLVLSEQRFLPRWLGYVHPRYGTPSVALYVMGGVFALLSVGSFATFVELNVIMYCAALSLESLSLIVLRVKEPQLPRPFKVPGGYPVLALVFLLPVGTAAAMVVFSIAEEGWTAQLTSLAALASGPIAYAVALRVGARPN